MKKTREPTWREAYAPKIASLIKTIEAENPGIELKRVRYLVGKENPGQYQHMKRVWAAEATRQVNELLYFRNGEKLPQQYRRGRQPKPTDPKQLDIF